MKVLLIGSNGQLGWELQRSCPAGTTLMSCDFPKIDLCSTGSIQGCIEKNHPDCIINAAAYTAVDRAEEEKDLAYRVNYAAVEEIAKLAEKESLNVIDEQIGTSTWARGLAKAIWIGVQKNISGTFHWTDAGVASWYDFAVAIQEEGIAAGLLDTAIPVLPVRTDRSPTPAKRPMYGVLDKTATWEALGISPIHWRKQLRAMLKELL